MTSTVPDLGVKLGHWLAAVRRARMSDRQKLAALIVGSYADSGGKGIVVGVARLAVDMDISHRTARRYLAWLREVGLIEMTAEGNRRKGQADEYRLIIAPDLGERIEVPDPAQYKVLCKEVAGGNQGSSKVTPEKAPRETPVQGSPRVSPERRIRGQNASDQGSHRDDPPPVLNTSPKRTTSHADDEDPCSDVAVDVPAVIVEIRPGAADEEPHRSPPLRQLYARRERPRTEPDEAAAAAARARRGRAAVETALALHRAAKEAK